MSDPTRPDGVQFKPVSTALIRVRVIGTLITFAALSAPFIVLGVLHDPTWYIAVGVILALAAWSLWLIPRQVRALGYYEGESEFLLVHGIMFRNLTVIPYGRVQYVDVSEGPIARRYGITKIELHTASSETSGALEGVPAAEAARLRDLLATRGSSEQAGL